MRSDDILNQSLLPSVTALKMKHDWVFQYKNLLKLTAIKFHHEQVKFLVWLIQSLDLFTKENVQSELKAILILMILRQLAGKQTNKFTVSGASPTFAQSLVITYQLYPTGYFKGKGLSCQKMKPTLQHNEAYWAVVQHLDLRSHSKNVPGLTRSSDGAYLCGVFMF